LVFGIHPWAGRSLLKNRSIIVKFLSIMVLFGVFAIITTVYSTGQMRMIDTRYSALMADDVGAALDMAIANHALSNVRDAIAEYQIADTDAQNTAAAAFLKQSREEFQHFMEQAALKAPAVADDIHALQAQVVSTTAPPCACKAWMSSTLCRRRAERSSTRPADAP
jgi:hypothetical protein